MRSPRAVRPNSVGFGLVHARTIVSHLRSRCAPCASFQGEDTYMPAGNVSGDIRRVAERLHVPELYSRVS